MRIRNPSAALALLLTTAIAARPAAAQQSRDAVRWVAALFPRAQVTTRDFEGQTQDVIEPVQREGLTGYVRAVNVLARPVAGGHVIAFVLEAEGERGGATRYGRWLQVIRVNDQGRFIGRPEGFPLGGQWAEGESGEIVRLLELHAVTGSNRAVVLEYSHGATDVAWDVMHVQGFALTAAGLAAGTRITWATGGPEEDGPRATRIVRLEDFRAAAGRVVGRVVRRPERGSGTAASDTTLIALP